MNQLSTVIFSLSQFLLLVVPIFLSILGIIIEQLLNQTYPTRRIIGVIEFFVLLGMPSLQWSSSFPQLKPIPFVFMELNENPQYLVINIISMLISIIVAILCSYFVRVSTKLEF